MKTTFAILALGLAAAASAGNFPKSDLKFSNQRELKEVNQENGADAHPWLSADGLRIYFIDGKTDFVMFSQRKDGNSKFSHPVRSAIKMDGVNSLWLTRDELHAYVTTGYEMSYLERPDKNSDFSEASEIKLNGLSGITFITEPTLDPTEKELIVTVDIDGVYNVVSFNKTSASEFQYNYTIQNPKGYVFRCGQLSKDGLSLFVSLESDDKADEKICCITRASLDKKFDAGATKVLDLDYSRQNNSQASVSDNLKYMVFMGSTSDSWENDDLYILDNESSTTPVSDPVPADSVIAIENPAGPDSVNLVQITVPIESINVIDPVVYSNDVPLLNDLPPVEPAETTENTAAKQPDPLGVVEPAMQLFPNPAGDFVNVKLSQPSERPVAVSIFNDKGELVSQQTGNDSSTEIKLNTENLAAGIYIVKCAVVVDGVAKIESGRLVIQR